MKIKKKEANLIARKYIASLILLSDDFSSDILTTEENYLIQDACNKIANKICSDNRISDIDDIVKEVKSLK